MFGNITKMTLGRVLLFCCFIGACFARSDEDIKKTFVLHAAECSKEIPVSGDEFDMMSKDLKFPRNKNAQCLVACVFRKTGMIDDKGMFDESSSIKMSEREYADEKDKIESAKKLYELCRKVNEEPVTDGDSGCERSALLATCLTENSASMGFSV